MDDIFPAPPTATIWLGLEVSLSHPPSFTHVKDSLRNGILTTLLRVCECLQSEKNEVTFRGLPAYILLWFLIFISCILMSGKTAMSKWAPIQSCEFPAHHALNQIMSASWVLAFTISETSPISQDGGQVQKQGTRRTEHPVGVQLLSSLWTRLSGFCACICSIPVHFVQGHTSPSLPGKRRPVHSSTLSYWIWKPR